MTLARTMSPGLIEGTKSCSAAHSACITSPDDESGPH